MDEQININNEWVKALTKGEVEPDKPRPKKVYKDWQISTKQRRGVMNIGNK